MNAERPSAGEDICGTCTRKDVKPGVWRHCVCIAPATFSAVLLQGREGTCKGLNTVYSIPVISILRSLWSFLRCFSIRSLAFFVLSSGSTKVQSLLGIYLKQPPQRDSPFPNLHTDIRDGPTCPAPRLSFRMEESAALLEN